MVKVFLVAAGAAVGGVLRYGLAAWTYRLLGVTFPWGTLAVNLVGCLAIGFLWALSERALLPTRLHPFIFVGVLGGFTTFSTFGLESLNLFRDGEVMLGLVNVLASNVLGLLFVYFGFILARLVFASTITGNSL